MNDTVVTVIIPTYNREKYVQRSVQSVLFQTYTHWKLLIMDDGSTDGTQEVISQYMDDPRISYIQLPQNGGTGKTMREALKHVDTPYFMILDSDDWLDPRAVEILLEEMQKLPEDVALVYSNTVVWSERQQEIKIKEIQTHRSFSDKYDFILYRKMLYPRFFRTQAVLDVGGFELDDPYQGRYMEDRYLLLKLINKYKFQHINHNLYHLRQHASNITSKQNLKKYEETRRYVYSKMLKQWGDEFEPIFETTDGGWVHLTKLVPRQPKVTVVIPVFNTKFLDEAIQSVFRQSMSEWVLLIIDDCSLQCSYETVRPYLSDDRVQYLQRPRNSGVCHVLNDALQLIQTPYFVQLDPDDWLEPHALKTLLESMENAGEGAALAYGNTLEHNQKKNPPVLQEKRQREFTDKFDVLLYRWMIFPRFYRTDAVRKVGGWETAIPYNGRYMEDRQILYKLAEQYRFSFVDQHLYNFRIHETNQTFNNIEKYVELRIYFVTKFFEKWNGIQATGKELHWWFNKQGWPQFQLVPKDLKRPIIGICVGRTKDRVTDTAFQMIEKRLKHSPKHAAATYIVFSLDELSLEEHSVKGYQYQVSENGVSWKYDVFPIPDSIYMRCGVDGSIIKQIEKVVGNRIFNNFFFNKWQAHNILGKDPKIKNHLPASILVDDAKALREFMKKNEQVFFKPINGAGGKGIVRVKYAKDKIKARLFSGKNDEQKHTFKSVDDLKDWIKADVSNDRYIAQTAVETVAFNGFPTNIRVNMSKNAEGKWENMYLESRYSLNASHVMGTLGIDKMALMTPELLKTAASKLDETQILNFGYEICRALDESGYHFAEIGIDMGLDEQDHLWIFEVNPAPNVFIQPIRPKLLATPFDYAYYLATSSAQ